MPRTLLARVAPIWVLALVIGSVLPDAAKIAIGTHYWHRLYHLLSFGSTAYLLTLIARTTRERLYALLFVIALGAAIEFSQHAIFGNSIEWWDIRDDTLGVLLAAVLSQWSALRQKLVRQT
jgi:hypothetical protein